MIVHVLQREQQKKYTRLHKNTQDQQQFEQTLRQSHFLRQSIHGLSKFDYSIKFHKNTMCKIIFISSLSFVGERYSCGCVELGQMWLCYRCLDVESQLALPFSSSRRHAAPWKVRKAPCFTACRQKILYLSWRNQGIITTYTMVMAFP